MPSPSYICRRCFATYPSRWFYSLCSPSSTTVFSAASRAASASSLSTKPPSPAWRIDGPATVNPGTDSSTARTPMPGTWICSVEGRSFSSSALPALALAKKRSRGGFCVQLRSTKSWPARPLSPTFASAFPSANACSWLEKTSVSVSILKRSLPGASPPRCFAPGGSPISTAPSASPGSFSLRRGFSALRRGWPAAATAKPSFPAPFGTVFSRFRW